MIDTTETEQLIIGSCLLVENQIEHLKDIKPELFSHTLHKELWKILLKTRAEGKKIYAPLLIDEVSKLFNGFNAKQDAAQFISSLCGVAYPLSKTDCEYQTEILSKNYTSREIIKLLRNVEQNITLGADPRNMIPDIQKALHARQLLQNHHSILVS